MKKTTILVTILCALCTGSLLAQTSCASFQIIADSDIPDTAYVDVHERFGFSTADNSQALFEGLVLPPGYTVTGSGNRGELVGEMQNPGTYEFKFLGRSPSTNCTDTVAFTRTYIVSPTPICEPMQIRSDWNSGTEHYVGAPLYMRFFVSDGAEDPPITFYGLNLRETATLDSLGNYTDVTTIPENFVVMVVAKNRVGCTDTLAYEIFVQCPAQLAEFEILPTGRKGQYYEQQVGHAPSFYPPFTNYVAGYPLPPGLTLSSDGVISGTPTQYGVFDGIGLHYSALGGCENNHYVTIRIEDSVPIQSPWISPLCAQSLSQRNWVVHNPNPFPIRIDWQTIYFNTTSGSFTAANGDNYFSTPDAGWPNSVKIFWYDQNLVRRSIVQGANDDLCTPLECLQVNGITFYHQGRQKDGNFVQAEFSNANAAMGAPDANDGSNSNSKSFSLGYDGFITMKLSANLYDQPGNDLKVWENSLNNPDYGAYPERAEVFVSTDNANWISLGLTNPTADCHAKLDWEFDLAGKTIWCRYVKVVDVTFRHAKILDPVTCQQTSVLAFNNVSNGFDLDAITCVNNPAFAGRMAADEFTDTTTPAFVDNGTDLHSVAYPNPATSWLTLDFSHEPEFVYPEGGQVEVSIIDMNGKVSTGGMHVLDDEWKTKVNLDRLSPGLFVAKVKAKGLSKYYKFSRN